jgi:hypothetical protein
MNEKGQKERWERKEKLWQDGCETDRKNKIHE